MSGFWNGITDAIAGQGLSFVTMTIFGAVASVFAGVIWMWAKYPVRWVLALGTVGLLILVFVYRDKVKPELLDQELPPEFFPPRFIWWILLLSLALVYLTVHLVSVWVQFYRGTDGDASGEAPRFPDLENAWDEIQIRLSHAQYDAGQQKVFLLVAPDESMAEAVIRAANLQLFAQAPVDENAPIHAYATGDGLFISCGGASAWGQGEDGTERLTEVCRKIRDLNAEQPALRGVAVIYPMESAASPEMLQSVGSLRNDLQTIRAELNVRVPTLAIFCLRDSYGGFDEFAGRIPSNVRVRRCGFSVPPTQKFDRSATLKGLGWLVQWFYTWSLKLMTDDYHDTDGNGNLVSMNALLWRDLPSLGHLLDASFSTHARAEPILVRGCYFVSGGADPDRRGFAAGLINGKSSKMIVDSGYTAWSAGAEALDRRYRLTALALAVGTGALAILIWSFQILPRFCDPEVVKRFRGWPWVAWGWLGLMAVVWAIGLWWMGFGGKRPTKPARGT